MMSQLAPKDKVSGEYSRPESQFRVKDFDDDGFIRKVKNCIFSREKRALGRIER